MSTVATPAIPVDFDNALYTALCRFYGTNRAVGAVEAVWGVILEHSTLVTRCDPTLREILELEVTQ